VTLRAVLREAVTQFKRAGLAFGHGTHNARDEAVYLILHTLKLPLGELDSVLDLCTGSGCLAVLAAHAFPGARVDAADLSAEALQVARRNVKDYALGKRVHLVQTDLFDRLAARQYDLILSNPPYVNAAAMRALPREYRREPRLALAGGRDGLALVHRILAQAADHLNPEGLLIVEIGHNRNALEKAYPRLAFTWLATSAGDDYVFMLRKEDLP